MNLFSLAMSLALPPLALASTVTKEFHFKEDFFLNLCPLGNAIGPDNVGILMSALEEFGTQFQEEWENQVKADLQNGACTIDVPSPEFSICDWRHPDQYDVGELPTPGQSYVYEGCFVQRIYYKFSGMTITCPEDFSYDDLNRDAYTEAAFSGTLFTSVLIDQCAGSEGECVFSTTESVNVVESDSENAELYISRYVDVPVYLKCLDMDGFGTSTANKLIKALDTYFELYVEGALTENILAQVPEAHVYGYASPYKSERSFCAHGPYYAEGNLVNQVRDTDGILVTKFTYGFDIIWFRPHDFEQELFPDIKTTINNVFVDEDFLLFLQTELPELDFVQDSEMCNVVDPDDIQVTLAPTEPPSPSPTSLFDNGTGCTSNSQCISGYCHEESGVCSCNIEADTGCSAGQACRFSCAYLAQEPRCYDDEYKRDCALQWGDGYTCADGNGDGIVDVEDKNSGCNYSPPTEAPIESSTSSPLPQIETISPTTKSVSVAPTPTISIIQSGVPSISILQNQTNSPTILQNQTNAPTIPLDEPTPSPTPAIPEPTPSPTSGNTDALGTTNTLSPTVFFQAITEAPVVTLEPTPAPTKDRSTGCNQACVVYPDDTEPDTCPYVSQGTCGNGNRGDGICPFEGYCCSEYGWCGTTAEYCESSVSNVPTPSTVEGAPLSPTYSIDAGKCGNGLEGEGLCAEASACCSDWGYCGSGENYCYTTRTAVQTDSTGATQTGGTCGGGGIGNGVCADPGLCCSRFGFCGEGEEYCTGVNEVTATDAMPTDVPSDDMSNITLITPDVTDTVQNLPENLQPVFGFRCGITEVDARSNCKKECTHHIQCDDSEECWGIQLNYCNTFDEGTHPVCTNLDMADNDSRCGYDETSARGHCGPKCGSDLECGTGEFCFPTLLNLCECIEFEEPEESRIVFAKAKSLLTPYFVEQDPSNGVAEGIPRASEESSSDMVAPQLVLAVLGVFITASLYLA